MNKRGLLTKLFLSIAVVSLLLASYQILLRYYPVGSSARADVLEVKGQAVQTPLPVRLIIPKINADLAIIPSKIENGEWGETKEGVSYLLGTPVPGDPGNSVIYGHNFPNLLGKLNRLQRNDGIYVTLENGTKRAFEVQASFEVTPDQLHILSQTEDTRLTIYTCSGFLDSKRFVIIATIKT